MRCKIKAGNHNQITQDEYATAVVIALGLDVRVCEQKDGEDNGDDIPPREDKCKCVRSGAHMPWVVPRAEGYHGRDLEEADLQCVGRANFHTAVGVQGQLVSSL